MSQDASVGCCCNPEKYQESTKPDCTGKDIFDHVFVTHSSTFPRQARLLDSFFLSGWRPAPERERAATATILRRFGVFVLLRFAILALKVVNSFVSQQNLAKRTQTKMPTRQVLITCA
jgi:hypothetical protein